MPVLKTANTEEPVSPKMEVYSFSKLNSFHTCPYGFKLRYIDGLRGIDNAFSLYGSFVHRLMEQYAKGELQLWELVDKYKSGFEEAVTMDFPANKYCVLKDKYFSQGKEFFSQFNGYGDVEILGVEHDFEIKIDDWKFVGIIDLIYRDKNGDIVIRDYKSKAAFKNEEEKKKYARQLYLYAMHIKEKYGVYPARVEFLRFRVNELDTIPFNKDAFEEAIEWARSTVNDIRNEMAYAPVCDEFYGENLCNHRETCELKELGRARYKRLNPTVPWKTRTKKTNVNRKRKDSQG